MKIDRPFVCLILTSLALQALALDIVVSGIEGINVWQRNADGSFVKTRYELSANRNNAGGAIGDLNGDGIADWFGAAFSYDPHQVWFGKSDGSFEASKQRIGGERASWGVALGDVDRDGDLDAFVSSAFGPETCQPSELWRNDGKGAFELMQLIGEHCSIGAILVDVDRDKDLDIVTATTSLVDGLPSGPGANKVWLNDGQGHFKDSGQNLSIGTRSDGVAAADLDRDRDADLVFANIGTSTVWFNDGEGRFAESKQRLLDQSASAVALADLDGDRDADAYFVGGGLRGNRIWWNDGSGHFKDSGQVLSKGAAFDVAIADIDEDGDPDALLAIRNYAHDQTGNVEIWLNGGKGRFKQEPITFGSGHFRRVAVGVFGRKAQPE